MYVKHCDKDNKFYIVVLIDVLSRIRIGHSLYVVVLIFLAKIGNSDHY